MNEAQKQKLAKDAVNDIMKVLQFYGFQGDWHGDIFTDIYLAGAKRALEEAMNIDRNPINVDEIPF